MSDGRGEGEGGREEQQAAHDLHRPGGVEEVGFLAAPIVDDALTDADVGEQFPARPQRVDEQHRAEKRWREKPGQENA